MHESPLRIALRGAFIGALLLAFIAALFPPTNAPALIDGQDKIGHFAVFLALGLLGLSAWPERLALIVIVLLLYGGAMEVAQSFTDHRYGDPWDWLADALGVGTSVVVQRVWQKSKSAAVAQARAEPVQPTP